MRCTKNKPVCILGIVAALLLMCQGGILAEPAWASSVEYRVKAAFLYNFTKFVEWPATGGGKGKPFQIGILGEDLFGDEIEGLAGKTVGDRILKVQRYPAWDDRAKKSDILFISGSQEKALAEIIRRLDGAPVLTVGDTVAYASRGVMINFFMEDNKVRFEINLKQAKRAGFQISSRLLKLAVILNDSAD
jgi:hypothetical protein